MASGKGKHPVGARRNALAAAIRERGQSPHNIWLIRPPFDKEDILVNSDVAFDFFYYIEGEPRFVDIDYRVLRAPARTETSLSIFDRVFAHATYADGRVVEVVLSVEPPVNAMTEHDRRHTVTLEMLNLANQRIENWRRIIPCIRRITTYPTATLQRMIVLGLVGGKRRTIRQIVNDFSDENSALVLGALAIVLRRREISADLDRKPWSQNTLVWSDDP